MPLSGEISLKNLVKSIVMFSRIQRTKDDRDVPLLYREPYIHTGYRTTHKKWTYYLKSLFQVHNETLNVWSHFLAAVVFIYLTLSYGQQFDYLQDARTWPILGFAFGTVCYALCSSFAHLFQSKSELANYTCFQIDYIGIGMNALGNSVLCYYITGTEKFYQLAGPHFFKFNILFSFFTCAGCAIAKLRYKRPYPIQRKILQIFAVAFETLYGSIPVIFKIGECLSDSECSFSEISPHVECFAWFLVSSILYSCHIPERFFPGMFDIVGFGHQLFHVVMAYTTCLQFKAAFWELQRRPQVLFKICEPRFWDIFGTIFLVLFADIIFVYSTHRERVKRAKIAIGDFKAENNNGACIESNGHATFSKKDD